MTQLLSAIVRIVCFNKCVAAATFYCVLQVAEARAQDELAAWVSGKWQQYSQQHLQEKLYAHVDRNFYSAGEIIWFSLYCVDGVTHRPLDLSKIAYVELLSGDGKAVLQAKVALREGRGDGSFLIPFSLPTGNYLFRAYTRWMMNLPPENFFEKQVSILNARLAPQRDSASAATDYDVQFLPEGGDMFNGMESTVAFRVVDRQGRGVDCQGMVVNARGDSLVPFRPLRFGLGHFRLKPEKGNEYSAWIVLPGGRRVKKALPVARDNGYILHLSMTDSNRLSVDVSSNLTATPPFVYLIVQSNQQLRFVQKMELKEGRSEVQLDKHMLGTGIARFTLFNADRMPVSERLYFIRPMDKLQFTAGPSRNEYGLRQEVSLDIRAGSASGPQESDLSVAVFLEDSLQQGGPVDIDSWLWLAAELKGNVENPSYYLDSTGPEAEEATDNLMLTQGWRRFPWEDVLGNQPSPPAYIPEYDGQVIRGLITDRRSGKPLAGVPVYLSVPGEHFSLNSATSNSRGELLFDVKGFYGPGELVLQAYGLADTSYRVDIQEPFFVMPSTRYVAPLSLPETIAAALNQRSIHAQVENHFLSGRHLSFRADMTGDSLPFYGSPDKKYALDDYTRFVTMEEVMREYVAEVRVRKSNEKFHYGVFDAAHGYFFENDPLVLLDGVPVFDISKMVAFDPLKIKKLEIVTHRYYLDSVIHEGIVSYSTYQGNLGGYPLDPGTLVMEWSGLQYEREFFSPKYETSELAGDRIPDFRNLLYWSAHEKTDSTGRLHLLFYSSDIPGNYRVVVEGITKNGAAGKGQSAFTVRKYM